MANTLLRQIYKQLIYILLLCTLIFFSCKNKDYTPKPVAYNRIDKPSYNYRDYNSSNYSFQYSDIAEIKKVEFKNSDNWFNIVYPNYDAIIYCSYLPITKQTLSAAIEDSYHLAYSHSIMADDINQQIYSDSDRHIGGMLYLLDGNVATPIQFFITDSISNFLRGSLYYSKDINLDSIAPVTQFVKDDILQIFKTIKF